MDLIEKLVPTHLPWARTPCTRPCCSGLHPTCLEHFQGGGIRNFSGKPIPVSHHPFFLISNLNLSSFCLKPLPLVLLLQWPCKKSLSSALVGPLQVLEGCYKVSLEPFLLQAEQPQLSRPFLIAEVLQPSDHFCGLLWTRSTRSMSFLC